MVAQEFSRVIWRAALTSTAAVVSLPTSAQDTPIHAPATAVSEENISEKLSKLLAKTDGRSQQAAIKVPNVGQEYKILRELGLRPVSQALVMDEKAARRGKAYDLITAVDRSGREVEMWFEVPFGF